MLGAVPRRADPRDGLVGATLAGLPGGRPGGHRLGAAPGPAGLRCAPISSSPTCGGTWPGASPWPRTGSVSAVVVAVAAMERLGWLSKVRDVLDPVDVLPQAGQGAIAVQCRADDAGTRELLAAIDHEPSHRALRAERAVLAALGGSCTLPVGAFAEPDETGRAGSGCRASWPAGTGTR